jgi:hypothetical protein
MSNNERQPDRNTLVAQRIAELDVAGNAAISAAYLQLGDRVFPEIKTPPESINQDPMQNQAGAAPEVAPTDTTTLSAEDVRMQYRDLLG